MKIIELHNISKQFGEQIVFDDFSLSIEQGDFVAIKGADVIIGLNQRNLVNKRV